MSKFKFSRSEAALRLDAVVESLEAVNVEVADPYTQGIVHGYTDALRVARDFILEPK
jgi:hypothetical protein